MSRSSSCWTWTGFHSSFSGMCRYLPLEFHFEVYPCTPLNALFLWLPNAGIIDVKNSISLLKKSFWNFSITSPTILSMLVLLSMGSILKNLHSEKIWDTQYENKARSNTHITTYLQLQFKESYASEIPYLEDDKFSFYRRDVGIIYLKLLSTFLFYSKFVIFIFLNCPIWYKYRLCIHACITVILHVLLYLCFKEFFWNRVFFS